MKKIAPLLLLLVSVYTSAQIDTGYYAHLNDSIRSARDVEFRNPEESPLEEDSIDGFDHLEYYAFDSNYVVLAYLERTPKEKPFKMRTSSTRLPEYVQYGILHFKLHSDSIALPVYRNLAHQNHPLYKNYLFLPFTDSTNSYTTYGGGRYLDLIISQSDSVIVDFNQAYNPYCAYNHKYSCPIPPSKNRLKIPIRAGVLKYGHD